MADKAPPPSPDQNILVYVPDYPKHVAPRPTSHHHPHRNISSNSHPRGPPPFVAYRTYENVNRNVTAEPVETKVVASSVLNEPSLGRNTDTSPDSVAPPFGWKRILTNGVIIYISPSNTALSSSDHVKSYLLTEGTCKCGLECPVNCDVIFNFNPKVLTRPWTAPVTGPEDLTKLCNHKRKLLSSSTSLESLDSRYDGLRKKKRKMCPAQPSVSQLLSQREQTSKERWSYNGLPWREGAASSQPKTQISNGFPDEIQVNENACVQGYRYSDTNSNTSLRPLPPITQYPHSDGCRFPPATLPPEPSPPVQQVLHEQHRPQTFDLKSNRKLAAAEITLPDPTQAPNIPPSVSVNRTPPWQQNKQSSSASTFDRIPPVHNPVGFSTTSASSWNSDKKKAPAKLVRKKCSDDVITSMDGIPVEQPSFMDDPSGYLAQQTALLNSTISRQNTSNPSIEGIQLASNTMKCNVPRSKLRPTSRFPDSSLERKKMVEEPSSTLPEQQLDDLGPIQGATVSTSNRSPVDVNSSSSNCIEVLTTVVTTMASGHTVSSNTVTSVLAGRANTATVTINNQIGLQKPLSGEVSPSLSRTSSQGSSMALSPAGSSGGLTQHEQNQPGKSNGNNQQHILVSTNGQLIVANSSLLSPQHSSGSSPKMSTTSPTSGGQIGVSSQVLNQPTVLVNTLPGPLLLQPSVAVVDGINTVQLPQIVGNVMQNQVLDENSGMLSPDSKRKVASLKRRKLSPNVTNTAMLLSPQGSNNVVVQQQAQSLNPGPMLQALTILPGKTNFPGTQPLIATNMLQPLNLVQNFPIQQFILPAGVSGMVMSDGTILQDAVHLNVLTPMQNTGVFSGGQNLLTPGMVVRTPSSQSANKVIQNNQFLGSPNQFVVNNTFSGQLSPMLSVSPTQVSRNQDYVPQNIVVQQPNTSNTTVLQQNTTIVQHTTTVSNQQTQPTSSLNLNQNFILNEKPNFILSSDKQNFILSPNNDKILLSPDNTRNNCILGNVEKVGFPLNGRENKQNLMVNNFEKVGSYIVDKKNSVSTQTQNQVLQISSSPALVVATSSGAMYNTSSCFSGSPPDTTTLSPIDQEVTTSSILGRSGSSPDPASCHSSQSCPMVHCISSSSQQEEGFCIDSYPCGVEKNYAESSSQSLLCKEEDDFDVKTSICNVPDSMLESTSEPVLHLKEET